MSVITRATHPAALWPGIKGWFGATYSELDQQWPELFERIESDKAYEEFVEHSMFGLIPVKPEAQGMVFDSAAQGYTTRLTNTSYAMGYICSLEEIQDGKYERVSRQRAQGLAFSARQTYETVHANIFNRAFAGTSPIGDGQAWMSAAHPTRAGAQSNVLAVASDLNEAALFDLSIQVRQAKNNRGLKIRLRTQRLIVHPNDMHRADILVNSALRSGTGNNDKNTLHKLFDKGVMVYDYLTDPDAFFIQTDAPMSLMHAERMAPSLEKDDDFDTKNAKAGIMFRFLAGVADWRGMYGSPGV
jgi:hypothetical protein